MKALLITNDPYEPSGVIGIYDTEEQKQAVIAGWKAAETAAWAKSYRIRPPHWDVEEWEKRKQEALIFRLNIRELTEVEIPIGVYGQYY